MRSLFYLWNQSLTLNVKFIFYLFRQPFNIWKFIRLVFYTFILWFFVNLPTLSTTGITDGSVFTFFTNLYYFFWLWVNLQCGVMWRIILFLFIWNGGLWACHWRCWLGTRGWTYFWRVSFSPITLWFRDHVWFSSLLEF